MSTLKNVLLLSAVGLAGLLSACKGGTNPPIPENLPPTADAGSAQTVMEGEQVYLVGKAAEFVYLEASDVTNALAPR